MPPLREKQRESLRDLVDRDTLVVLAPGSGKTAIRSAVQRATAARSLAEK